MRTNCVQTADSTRVRSIHHACTHTVRRVSTRNVAKHGSLKGLSSIPLNSALAAATKNDIRHPVDGSMSTVWPVAMRCTANTHANGWRLCEPLEIHSPVVTANRPSSMSPRGTSIGDARRARNDCGASLRPADPLARFRGYRGGCVLSRGIDKGDKM